MGERGHVNLEKPSSFLVENISLLPIGKALDIAMGGGRNTVYLAKHGFAVEGIDISSTAISNAKELARKSGVIIKTEVADLEKNYKIRENVYIVIICFNYLQRSIMQQIKNGLKNGGMVVYETYITDQLQYGQPRNLDHLLGYNELLGTFREFRCLRYREGIIYGSKGPKAIASIIAQKC